MPVPNQYIFRINNAYVHTEDDLNEITADDGANLSWGDSYKNFKRNIRRHLKLQQNGRCAFCRCRVSVETSWSNLEHLVSKSDYPQFKTLCNNIVYSCTKCNMSKVKKNTLTNPVVDKTNQEFPINSEGFLIVNPYHDHYEAHIDFIEDIIIIAVTPDKGRTTLEAYNLTRPELAEGRASELMLEQKSVNERLVLKLTDATLEHSTIEQINSVIEEMPYWTL
jgi:uncharacterized protein (TIGR02646 family)